MKIHPYFLMVAIVLPLEKSQDWTELKFRKIPQNSVIFSADHITVSVDQSASPLVYKFNRVQKVQRFKVEIEVEGGLNKTASRKPIDFESDSMFRFGLVATGPHTLNKLQRWLAAEWVQKLFALAPHGVGLDKIYFYNITQYEQLLSKKRQHPESEYLQEENVWLKKENQNHFVLEKILDKPLVIAGIWISIDGDDTKSKYMVKIKKIELYE